MFNLFTPAAAERWKPSRTANDADRSATKQADFPLGVHSLRSSVLKSDDERKMSHMSALAAISRADKTRLHQ